MMNLASQLYFFIRAAMGLDISRVIGLAISKAVLIRTNVAIDFSGLFL